MIKRVENFSNQMNVPPPDLNPGDFIDTAEAAAILGVRKGTLEVWRHQGKGPEFCKFGRSVRYYKPSLHSYRAKSCRMSTSEG